MNPPESPTAPPGKGPSAGLILACLAGPAVVCFALGLAANDSGGNALVVLLLLTTVAGSLGGGIAGGILLAKRLVAGTPHFGWIAAALSLAGIVVAGGLCFGGCLAGIATGDNFL